MIPCRIKQVRFFFREGSHFYFVFVIYSVSIIRSLYNSWYSFKNFFLFFMKTDPVSTPWGFFCGIKYLVAHYPEMEINHRKNPKALSMCSHWYFEFLFLFLAYTYRKPDLALLYSRGLSSGVQQYREGYCQRFQNVIKPSSCLPLFSAWFKSEAKNWLYYWSQNLFVVWGKKSWEQPNYSRFIANLKLSSLPYLVTCLVKCNHKSFVLLAVNVLYNIFAFVSKLFFHAVIYMLTYPSIKTLTFHAHSLAISLDTPG